MRKKWKETQSVTTFSSSCKDSIKSIKKSPKFSIKKRTRRPCCPKNGRREKRASRATISKSRRWISNSKKKEKILGANKKERSKKSVGQSVRRHHFVCAPLRFFLRVCLLFFFERAAFCCFLEFVPFFFTEFYRVLLPPVPHWPIRHTHEKNGPKMRNERGACLTEFPRFGAFIFFLVHPQIGLDR